VIEPFGAGSQREDQGTVLRVLAEFRAVGVAEIFGPGTTIAQVAEFLRANAHPRD
jgi:methylmalonyl-CoA mutase cobalamin-binding subunit